MSFDNQVVNATSAAYTLLLTNNYTAPLNGINVVTAGDFEAQSNCQSIAAGTSCAITVRFTPKRPGKTFGSLTISANPSEILKMPRVVLLRGNGLAHCNAVRFAWTWSTGLVLVLTGLYFLGLVLVRWHMIAKPTREQLCAQVRSIRSWVESESGGPQNSAEDQRRVEQIKGLLDDAAFPLNHGKIQITTHSTGSLPMLTRFFNAIFWTRGQELARWSCTHQAEQLMVALLPQERVRAWMETAEQELRQLDTQPDFDTLIWLTNDHLIWPTSQ
jgi:hypothetical protein